MAKKRMQMAQKSWKIEEIFPRFVNAQMAKGVSDKTVLTYEEKYIQAKNLMDTQKYDEAIALFSEIRGYQDADKLRRECGKAKLYESAKSNFAGKWIWNYPGWINPWDQYYNIDFDTMTIEFYFKSESTEFTRTFEFEVESDNVLAATGFRDAGTVYIHYLGEDIFLEYPSGSKKPSYDDDVLYLHRK